MNLPDSSRRRQFYESELLRVAPRLLSATDRCPVSSSSGCMDREYWAWATKDFANLDLQRGVLILAYLHRTPFPDNVYNHQPALLEWLSAALRFWISRQDRHGGFDHLYIHENSWMAAAFTLVDVLHTLRLVGDLLEPGLKQAALAALNRAGEMLLQHEETHGFISNHRAGAAAGLLDLANLTGREDFRKRAWDLMAGVYARQSSEGWFLEYEGADPGYQTLDTHYQALFYIYSQRDKRVLEQVARSLEFLSYFLHPDGSVGGEYGSRSCPHFFPGGFEVFAADLPLAAAMARMGAKGLMTGNSCGLGDADFRNEIPLATSYVLAHQWLNQSDEPNDGNLPVTRVFERIWPQAGLYVRSDAKFYSVFGASKGGVVKVFDKETGNLLHSSCGYEGRLARGVSVTTQLWTLSPRLQAEGLSPGVEAPIAPQRRVGVEAPFFRFRRNRCMSALLFLCFRIFNLTWGRVRQVNDFVRKKLIIGRYLKSRKPVAATLKRCLRFQASSITVEDTLIFDPALPVRELREHGFFSTVYMASARYFRNQDFNSFWDSDNLADKLHHGRLTRSYKVSE